MVSVIEPAYIKTQFDANFLEPDAKLDEYREIRMSVGRLITKVMATADEPSVVADVVLKAATAARPKLRYTAGVLAGRPRLRLDVTKSDDVMAAAALASDVTLVINNAGIAQPGAFLPRGDRQACARRTRSWPR